MTQEEFIGAIKNAYEFSEELSKNLGLDIFPYSVFYIFFEQYLYITDVAMLAIGLAVLGTSSPYYYSLLVGMFIVILLTVCNVFGSLIIVATVIIIEIDVIGIFLITTLAYSSRNYVFLGY